MKNILFFVLIFWFPATNGLMKTRFRSMKCTVLNETVLTIDFCYVKAYSRTYATLNWGDNLHMPWGPPLVVIFANSLSPLSFFLTFLFLFQLKAMFKYRYGTIFREIFHAEFDLCILSDGKSDNLVMKAFKSVIKKSAPTVFQGCPFKQVSFTQHKTLLLKFISAGYSQVHEPFV